MLSINAIKSISLTYQSISKFLSQVVIRLNLTAKSKEGVKKLVYIIIEYFYMQIAEVHILNINVFDKKS